MERRKKAGSAGGEQDIRKQAGQQRKSFKSRLSSSGKEASENNDEGYEAFISYRHLPLDIFVAENLHKLLEHYTIPKKARWGGRKHIRHIFRDRDELPISSDLSASITDALHKADHLIIICTPQTMESAWVQKEIETFLQTHSRDDIILVLAQGEPEESFPEIVLKAPDPEHPGRMIDIEPLAADVRGTSRKEVLKKMKEEKLRIMASLLTAPYDTLVQRDRDFRMKRIVTVGSVISICLLSFGIYTAWQNRQISLLYRQTNRALAESTARTSQTIYEAGDRNGAIETLLSAVDENGDLLSAEQIYPLSVYTGAYHSGLTVGVDPVDYFETEAAASELKGSPDGKYVGWRNKNNFCIYDLEHQKILRTIKPGELYYRYFDQSHYSGTTKSNAGLEFIGNDTVLVYLEGSLFLVNYQSGDVLARASFDEEEANPAAICQMDVTENTVTVLTDEGICQYDLKNNLKEITDIPLDEEGYSRNQSISVSPGADRIALCIDSDYSDSKKKGLALITPLEDKKIQWLSDASFASGLWLDDHTLITMSSYNASGNTNQYQLTTWQDGKALKESGPWSLTHSQKLNPMKMVHLDQKDQLAVFSELRLYMLDPLSHEVNWQFSFSEATDEVYTFGNDTRFLIKTGNQNIYSSSVGGDLHVSLIKPNNRTEGDPVLICDDKKNLSSLVTLSFSNSRYVLIRYEFWRSPEECIYPFQNPVDVQWGKRDQQDPVYLAVGIAEDYGWNIEEKEAQFTASLFHSDSNEPTLTVECLVDNPALIKTGVDLDVSYSKKVPFDPGFTLIVTESSAEIVWSDGRKLYRQMENEKAPSVTYLSLRAPAYITVRKDGDWTAVSDDKGIHLYEWNVKNRLYQEKKFLEVPSKALEMAWAADDRYLVLSGNDWLRVWDQEKEDWVLLEGTEKTDGVLTTGNYVHTKGLPRTCLSSFRLGKKKPLLLITVSFTEENGDDTGLLVYDLSSGKRISWIDKNQLGEVDTKYLGVNQADFTYDDQSLILVFNVLNAGESEIFRYSLTENKVLWRQELFDSRAIGIISSQVIASDIDQSFILDALSGLIYSRTGEVLTGKNLLYQYNCESAILCASFDIEEIFYSTDLKQAVQFTSDGFILTPILSTQQLADRGREMLKEAEQLHQEKTDQETD